MAARRDARISIRPPGPIERIHVERAFAEIHGLPLLVVSTDMPLATSEVWAAVAIDEDDTSGQHVTPGTGWTEQVETVTYDPNLQVQTRTGSTSSSVSWNHLSAYPNGEGLVVALEIRSA